MTFARFSSVGLAICYVLPVFVNDTVFYMHIGCIPTSLIHTSVRLTAGLVQLLMYSPRGAGARSDVYVCYMYLLVINVHCVIDASGGDNKRILVSPCLSVGQELEKELTIF